MKHHTCWSSFFTYFFFGINCLEFCVYVFLKSIFPIEFLSESEISAAKVVKNQGQQLISPILDGKQLKVAGFARKSIKN